MSVSRKTPETTVEEISQLVNKSTCRLTIPIPEIKINFTPLLVPISSQARYTHFFKAPIKTFAVSSENGVRGLPDELWLQVYTFLDTSSLVNCLVICKGLRLIANEDGIRKKLYQAKTFSNAKVIWDEIRNRETKRKQETSLLAGRLSTLGQQYHSSAIIRPPYSGGAAYNDNMQTGFVMTPSKAARKNSFPR